MERMTIEVGSGLRACVVAYVIYDNVVYFTKIGGNRSSINVAEEIVKAISEKEGRSWGELDWVDVQTTEFYSQDAVDKLIFAAPNRLSVSRWEPTILPPEASSVLFEK